MQHKGQVLCFAFSKTQDLTLIGFQTQDLTLIGFSIEAVCLHDKYHNGPAAYNRCVSKQLASLHN
jgi:hypothetical protein